MDSKKINLANYMASLELEGIDKIKQDLKEIEESLDRILSKYEKIAVHELELHEQSNNLHSLSIEKNKFKLDNLLLKGVTNYNLSTNSSTGITEFSVSLIIDNSKIEI